MDQVRVPSGWVLVARRSSSGSPVARSTETPERTRLELEHNIDRHEPGWQSVVGGVDGDEGWPLYLARYAALFKESN